MSTRAQVESLLTLIRDSAYNALEEYEKHGEEVPNLDALEKHPLDKVVDKMALKKIIRNLEGACDQLCATLALPTHSIMNRAQDFGWACLRVAVKHRIADALANYPNGLHVSDLAQKQNIHATKLATILKALAARHCFREVTPNVFANNRLSLVLLSSHPMSAKVDMATCEGQRSAAFLSEYLVDPNFGYSKEANKAPFQYTILKNVSEKQLTFFDWLNMPKQQERHAQFGNSMIAVNEVLGALAPVHVYPWNEAKTICDIGSGIGHFSRALLRHSPNVHVTLFDIPKTINLAKKTWKSDFVGRVQFIGGNFFDEIPATGYDVYYLRNILHNWNDAKATKILQSVRAAMGSHSRLLIHDPVLRYMCRPSEGSFNGGLEDASDPLLPNYGAGQIQVYQSNMIMLLFFNSRDRTIIEMCEMMKAADLRLLKVYDLAETCLLELCLASTQFKF